MAGGEPFGMAGGPSWKPLPVLFTGPFALAGGAAPALWLLVARTGALLAVAGAFRLAERLAGRWAGAIAAIAVLLLDGFVSLAWRGASEPLLLACILWAVERHLADRRRTAWVLGVAAALIRPEVVPFLLVYAVVQWRGAELRERLLLAGGLALVPLLWLGVPAIGGDPFAAATTASSHAGGTHASAWTALKRGLALPLAPVWVLACLGGVERSRDRALQVLWSGAFAWLALVVAMTAAGYAGVARYMLPAAAVASVLAAVAVVDLLASLPRHRRSIVVAVAFLALAYAGMAVERAATIDDQVREGVQVARSHDDLRAAIAVAGGRPALQRCALTGWVAVNHVAQTALAWELHVNLDRVALVASRPGVVFAAPRSAATGAPPRIALAPPLRRVVVARAGMWRAIAVWPAAATPAASCPAAGSPADDLAGVRPRAQNHSP